MVRNHMPAEQNGELVDQADAEGRGDTPKAHPPPPAANH